MRNHRFANLASAASLAVAAVVLTCAPGAKAAEVPISEAARTHFAAGVALLQDPKAPRYEEAYREFKAAYAASPSYKILGNLGLCAMKIERDREAINAYETYLKEAGPEVTTEERAQLQRDLLTLKAGIVEVTVSSSPPGANVVDTRTPVQGADVRNAYGEVLTPLPLGLRRGHHIITARMPGYLDQQWEFEAGDAPIPPHVFEMQRPAAMAERTVRERPIPTAAYVAGGATIALLATGSYFGLAALQKHNDFTKLNDGSHVTDAESAKTSGQTLNIVADSFLGAAVVGAVVTGYFLLSRPTVERPLSARLLPFRVTPAWQPGARGGGGGTATATATWRF